MSHEANHPVRTTEKSLELIKALQRLDGARIYELREESDMTKGAIHNHLSTLREHGFVSQVGDEYRLNLQFLTIGGQVRSHYPIYEFGRQKVDQLADDTGMLTNLMVEENGQGVYLYQSKGEYAVSLDTHVGYRSHLHNTGIGKAILAYLPQERVEEIIEMRGLPQATENTITEPAVLFEELETVREQGYALDREERAEGVACIAVPILLDDEIRGAISISAPTRRLSTGGFDDEIISQVKSTATELSLDIKHK